MKDDYSELTRIGFELNDIGFELNKTGFDQEDQAGRERKKHIFHLYMELIHENFTDLTNVLAEAAELVRLDFPESDEDKLRGKFLRILSTARMISESQEFIFSELEKRIMEGKTING